MLPKPLRPLLRLAAMPFANAARSVQTFRNGRRAVVEVAVARLDDGLARTQWLKRLARLGRDKGVGGVVLRLDGVPGSYATCDDLRGTVRALRACDKRVIALLEAPSNASLWVAAACDEVWLVPTGEVSFVGLAAELVFFGAALERLGLRPDFEAAGAYKSFGEPFTRTFASVENREATTALVEGLQGALLDDLAADRAVTADELRDALANAPLSAGDALARKLVDRVGYADELRAHWQDQFGFEPTFLDFASWSGVDAAVERLEQLGVDGPTIAVLHLDGPIVVDDDGAAVQVRARVVVEHLRELYDDKDVRAVVLAVDSPGGSALASDLIWREVERLNHHKPVIAVYGDVSASGGVYLAAASRRIIARRTTLTGSIGVFGGKVVAGDALRQLGVSSEIIAGAPHAGMFSAARPFSDSERARFRDSLQRFYDAFVGRVAAGRGRDAEDVEPHCRGRVWTGADALQRGLVDEIGDITLGVTRAREAAGLGERGWRRVDLSGQPKRSYLQVAVSKAVREALPGRAQALAERLLLGPHAALVQLVLRSDAEPLALCPVTLDPP